MNKRPNMDLQVGDIIQITSGPLLDQQGEILQINTKLCKISIDSFGYVLVAYIDKSKLRLVRQRIEIIEEKISSQIIVVNSLLLENLSKHPNDLYQLDPYKFEEIVAEILAKMGYEITLTPKSRDKGRDILALFNSPAGRILTIVDCKRYAEDRKIGAPIVERFLWVSEMNDKASKAMIVTTSFYTSEARNVEKNYKYKLSLKDFEDLKKWLSDYGSYQKYKKTEYWSPFYLKDSDDNNLGK